MFGIVYVVTLKETSLFTKRRFHKYYVFSDYSAVLEFADQVKKKYKEYDQVPLQSEELFHGFTKDADEVECFYTVEPLLDSAESYEL